ncbi:hypothetical protein GYMLUDRAFT_560087 [Collybiopsis luxurians FD-317 M1]|uniref:Secreted protein n=1 Tax=Collybiopsis luxurians FD-317 M1 TaxID=944289 RepID=A0A0D0CZH7_9AGAR|nr:hypothetical protein GYMLUDRAFT_560087 [Collybiopsis luxurians FD-317 M1]
MKLFKHLIVFSYATTVRLVLLASFSPALERQHIVFVCVSFSQVEAESTPAACSSTASSITSFASQASNFFTFPPQFLPFLL